MNKFKYYFVLLLAGIAIVSCNKSDDDVVVTPPRDYAEQYKADNDSIVKYLKTHYIEDVNANFDIKITKIPAGGTQTSVWEQTTYPLQSRDIYNRDVNYKVYFLTLTKGTGESPCNTDRILASYNGTLLDGTVFDSSNGLGVAFNLYGGVIDGWSEIFPQFKTGTSTTDTNGVITNSGFGAGVMFLPSGLGYYNEVKSSIPAYSPLVFSFKLFQLSRADSEYAISSGQRVVIGDGVPDYLEDLNKDGYLYDPQDKVRYPNLPANLIDDTDGDGIPDFLDLDDDGDGYTTRFEITKPTGEVGIVNGFDYGARLYYPWDPILVDDPATPNTDEREPRGIPAFSADGNPDYTSPDRLRIHLDKLHYKAKP